MKTKTKALALALCAVLLVVSTVFVTMAYLTSKTDVVTNTFTVGKVTITLDEADVDLMGVKDGDTRVKANEYKLIPGHTYIKDPTIHVAGDSENCWLFVKVENGLKDIIAGNTSVSENDSTDTVYSIEAQMTKNGWSLVAGETNIYAYKATAKTGDYKVFDNFKLKGDANVSNYATVKDDDGNITGGKTIEVTAYAIQADGFATAAAAWAEAPSDWETPAN